MFEEKVFHKEIDDLSFEKFRGKNFDIHYYTHIIKKDTDGYKFNNAVLFKFRKNVIPEKLSKSAIEIFLQEAKKKHSNRGVASGIPENQKNARSLTKTGQNEGQYISSNIAGYYDRPLREHRKKLKTIVAGRTTAFTRKYPEQWKSSLPFITFCSNIYKKLCPKEYRLQKKEWKSIHDNLKIPHTVFTTITTNYNWRTACHKDTGDFSGGLGNLIIVGKNFTGGYLGFPQFKVLIYIEPGDMLIMDVHEWHCNTQLNIKTDGFRLSFVMYIREDMSKCKKHVKLKDMDYYL
jgi:hypothetical protein